MRGTYREKRPRLCCKPNASERRDDEPAGSIVDERAVAVSHYWQRTSQRLPMNPEQQGKTYPALPAAPVAVAVEGYHLHWLRCLVVAVDDGTERPPIRTTNAGRPRSSPWPMTNKNANKRTN